MPRSEQALAGRGIVVTRPIERARELAGLIERSGGTPYVFPAIEIRDVADAAPLHALMGRLEQFDLAVFVSPTAAGKALDLLGARAWPHKVRAASVGGGTQRLLEKRGVRGVLAPASAYDSEALLELPELRSAAGRKVVIFRGEGGRELIADTLAERGAQVEHAVCYVRARPGASPAPLLAAWERGALHAVTVSSSQGLANLMEMLGAAGAEHLKATPLFVPHPRVAETAARLGVQETVLSGPGDAQVLERLVAYWRG